MSQPLPQIDPQRCNGCGRCVEVCPGTVFEIQNGKAMLVRPERCTYCMTCEEDCPTDAIALPFEIVVLQPTEQITNSAKSIQ